MQLNKFEKLLLRNSSQLEQVDKLLMYITTFLPGQSPSMELITEGTVSLSTILQIYKNQVLNKVTKDTKKSLHSKFLDAEYCVHKQYKVLAYTLSVIKSTELYLEMSSSKFKGERGRWRMVLLIESVKCALRLGMIGLSRRSLPSIVPVHEVEADEDDIHLLMAEMDNLKLKPISFDDENYFKALKVPGNRLQPPNHDNLRPPGQLLRKMNLSLAISEILSVLRPPIYAYLLYRCRNRKRSWTPWVIGLVLDVASQKIARDALSGNIKPPVSGLESEIYQDRDRNMLWWLMRGRMYDEYTRVFLHGIINKLMTLPVLSVGARLLEDYLYLFDEYYFASATL